MAYAIQLKNVTPYNGEKGPSVSSNHTGSEHTKLDINDLFCDRERKIVSFVVNTCTKWFIKSRGL